LLHVLRKLGNVFIDRSWPIFFPFHGETLSIFWVRCRLEL
jgi:hypothetical protein